MDTIFLIDFGLSKYFRPGSAACDKKFNGTPYFASINSMLFKGFKRTYNCVEKGAADDLEALGLILIYFLKKELPWLDKATVPKKNEKSMQIF
jgi:serine/threonine protein kinase